MKGYITAIRITPDYFGQPEHYTQMETGKVELEIQIDDIRESNEFKEAMTSLQKVNIIIEKGESTND